MFFEELALSLDIPHISFFSKKVTIGTRSRPKQCIMSFEGSCSALFWWTDRVEINNFFSVKLY